MNRDKSTVKDVSFTHRKQSKGKTYIPRTQGRGGRVQPSTTFVNKDIWVCSHSHRYPHSHTYLVCGCLCVTMTHVSIVTETDGPQWLKYVSPEHLQKVCQPCHRSWARSLKPFCTPLYMAPLLMSLGFSTQQEWPKLHEARIYLRNEKAFQDKQK